MAVLGTASSPLALLDCTSSNQTISATLNLASLDMPRLTNITVCRSWSSFPRPRTVLYHFNLRRSLPILTTRCAKDDGAAGEESKDSTSQTPFGYTRKDVLLIGLGVAVVGFGLKYGLEYAGVDTLLAGNIVQLVIVLGLTVGWISTYIFRVSNKEMTYIQQLRDYETKVMEKRLEGLTEGEIEALLEQVEEEKRRITERKQAS